MQNPVTGEEIGVIVQETLSLVLTEENVTDWLTFYAEVMRVKHNRVHSVDFTPEAIQSWIENQRGYSIADVSEVKVW